MPHFPSFTWKDYLTIVLVNIAALLFIGGGIAVIASLDPCTAQPALEQCVQRHQPPTTNDLIGAGIIAAFALGLIWIMDRS